VSARRVLTVCVAGLGACSERVIASAGDDVLVVIENIERGPPTSTADVHYVFARPQAMSDEAGAPRAIRMRYEASFDCTRRAWGHHLQELTLANGESVTSRKPEPDLQSPSPDSIGASVLRAVCDPDFYGSRATKRPLKSIERDYLEAKSGAG
jgi:hypothetical protein